MPDTDETRRVEVNSSGAHHPPLAPHSTSPPENVELEVEQPGGKVRVPLQFDESPLLVGRGDEENAVALDMMRFNALENGVSRRHAAFLRLADGLFVEDLDSKNGTRINGFVLPPNKLYRLRNSDEIEFGRLRTTIRFRPPAQTGPR